MKKFNLKKLNRIALISFVAAAFLACNSLTAYAALSPQTRVVYTGGGTSSSIAVENAENLDAFKGLMPGGTTKPQNITIANRGSQNARVYFQAQPTDISGQNVLQALQLKVTFKMDDSSGEKILYEGPASGTSGKAADSANSQDKHVTDATKQIPLGFVYANSETGVISATLTAPETMGNEYRNAQASIKWILQFETDSISSIPHNNNGGGDGGGGTNIATESIAENPTPQVGPSSVPEEIPNEDIPLSNPPKTGQDPAILWGAAALAAAACAVFALTRRKIRHGV
ncbi:MAG TPA: hypothetical protein VHP54_02945 [Caproiciproducens sp.]|nr:hypothetical protein [Caproiciproducens sp.]